MWLVTKLSFRSTPPPPCKGRAVVVSDRLNLSQGTRDVRGMCNFLSSVSPQQRFEVADQCYSSVTAQSFIWQAKESTPFVYPLCDGGPTPKKRPQSIMASSFYTFVSSPPWACPMQIGIARRAVCFTWGSDSGPRIFFCSIFFSLSFSHCHFFTPFSYSNYLIALYIESRKMVLMILLAGQE